MRRTARTAGIAALLAAALTGGLTACTGGSAQDSADRDAKSGSTGTTAAVAQPGKYGSLPEPCGAVDRGTLDSLLPGLRDLDQDEREKAYRGTLTPTFDNERRIGCSWKAEGSDSSGGLKLDLERVVSYDAAVSDDERAKEVYAELETAADLPQDSATTDEDASPDSSDPSSSSSTTPSSSTTKSPTSPGSPSSTESSPSTPSSVSPSSDASATGLQSRTLSDLGDSAYLDDRLGEAGSGSERRTVTVVFRTSNVLVTIRYQQQPARAGELPDSKEMQDKAEKLAARVAGSFDE